MNMKMGAGVPEDQIVDFVGMEQVGDRLGRAVYAVHEFTVLLKRQVCDLFYVPLGGQKQPA